MTVYDFIDESDTVRLRGEIRPAPGGSQAVRIVTVNLAYADFVIAAGYGFAPVYSLQPGEHLLFVLGRVTEVFDDLTAGPFALTDGDVQISADIIGFSGSNLGPGLPTASNGLIDLEGSSVGGNNWSSIDSPYTPESAAVPLFLSNTFVGGGATGTLTVWLYIGTP